MKLKKFVDRLPIMNTLKSERKNKKGAYYEVQMEEFTQKLHRDLRPTRLWGYNRQFPGPTIEVNKGEPIQVKWINNLPRRHILPVDKSIHEVAHHPEVRTVTHLHGSETKPESDGYPEAWYTRNFKEVGPFFKREIYEYPNRQRAATLWYHDHAMGITRLNMYAGLAGMYIIRDEQEKRLNLPKGKYEVPLVIQDRTFNKDGSLFYPRQPDDPASDLPNPSISPFFIGDKILVNGKVWPYFEVEPRKYRFRILNASNTRAYQLTLDSNQPFYQIGSDGGLLQRTVKMEKIAIEPAERVDVIIDFSKHSGKTITLKNDLGPNASPEDETDEVMQFDVNLPLSGTDHSNIPQKVSHIPSLRHNKINAIRNLKLAGSTDEYGRPLLLLDNKKWMDPVTENPHLGATEIWALTNITGFTHPIHIHLIQFQILDRRPFDLDSYNKDGRIVYTGSAIAPEPNERGWKDTVAAPSAQITRLIMKFVPYAGDYVWHCHILEHEDYDMMRPLRVIDPKRLDHGK
ncbi:multicopper oxidase family protein [Virgibacillus necropolis]|uniref:Copper oxidase n=1 Tax=Virgibacillus necropolis TaxID=163877 RepID=A0A221MGI2_9BACI|nr:multicopper oxidase domain-containing protein [Virgibacillus necropolis]ASN06722.1 copper oxidase [Virgibacillus necropolis]